MHYDDLQPDPRRSTTSRLLRTLLVLGVLGALTGTGTWAAFSATTANSGNSFASGTVSISDNDAGSALFNVSAMKPNDPTRTSCITVTYTGSLPSSVRLYGATGGTGLDQYLNLRVLRGTNSSPSGQSCSGFTPDATDYRGSGAGVVFDGTLQGFADDYASGLVDPVAASPESWTTSEVHSYRFEVSLQDTDAAQGKTASQTFTWEARNQ